MKKKPEILGDHKRVRRKLIPPILIALGDGYSPYSWARELVPEFLWIALLHEQFGLDEGAKLATLLGRAAAKFSTHEPKPIFANITSFLTLLPEHKAEVLNELGEKNVALIVEALATFNSVCPDNPLGFLFDAQSLKPSHSRDEKFDFLLSDLYDRNSRTAALTMATSLFLGMDQGKIHHAAHLYEKRLEDFKNIADYPKTERSKAAASAFRASAAMFLGSPIEEDSKGNEDWLVYFWEKISGFGECITNSEIELDEPASDDPYWKIISSYRNAAKVELKTRLNSWKFDLNSIEKFEVIGSLLARQTTLAIEIASTPDIWNPNLAPMILRGMADVYVTMAWILLDLEPRSKQFIDDALGSIKLEMEHRKQEIGELQDSNEKQKLIDIIEMQKLWLDSQRLNQFIEVNLGSWSGLNTRKMAEEAGCLSFYNYVYQPFSSAVHSNWYHTSTFNTSFCENPAHRYHKIATIREFQPDPFWLHLAAKYLEKAFAKFDEVTGVTTTAPGAFEMLLEMLDQLQSNEELGEGNGQETPQR